MPGQAEQGGNVAFGQRSLKEEKSPGLGAGGDSCVGVPLISPGLLFPEVDPGRVSPSGGL